MEVDAALGQTAPDRPQSRQTSRGYSRSRSRSLSHDASRSPQRDDEWRVDIRMRVPRHKRPCSRCTDYLQHLIWADDAQDESLEATFDNIGRKYAEDCRDEVNRLEARLDESRDSRDRDLKRWEKAGMEAQRWKVERDAARNRVRELEDEVERLRTGGRNSAAPAAATTRVPDEPKPANVSGPLPATGQRTNAHIAPVISTPLGGYGPRASFAQRLAVPPFRSSPRTPTAEAGPSRPLAPRPAPPGDEALALQTYNAQFEQYDDEREEQLDEEDEVWRAERDAKRARKAQGKGKGKLRSTAPSGAAADGPPGPPTPATGDKRKTAPTSPDGARPNPSAQPRAAPPHRAGQPSQLRPAPPRPTEGNWILIRGSHWLRDEESPEVQAWQNTSDLDIASLFSPARRRETGETTRQQRLIMSAPMPPDRFNRSFLQNSVNRAVLEWGEQSNHPVSRGESRSGGVLIGPNLVFNPVDLNAQFFFNQLQRLNSSRGSRSRLPGALVRVIRNMFTRPGRYEQLVASLDPGATDHGPTATRLDSSSAVDFSVFREPEDMTEEVAAEYLWQTLRVPRSVAQEVLQPYARRLARVGAAMGVWRARVTEDRARPPAERQWQVVTEREASQLFRPRSMVEFSITDVRLFASPPIVFWAMPVGPLEATVDELDANLGWIPESLREAFAADYRARVAQLEGA